MPSPNLMTALSLLLVLPCSAGEAPEAPKSKAFPLGEVNLTVLGNLEVAEQVNAKVDLETATQLNRDTAGSALALMPGVSLTLNSRNEQMIYVRGLDSRQVPVFLDGIPVFVPYDGTMDYARLTTFDIAEIQLSKGFSPILYGANTLGGAINLVTRRPTERFEGNAALGAFSGEGRKAYLNAGSRVDHWYAQAGISYNRADTFPLSANFQPTSLQAPGDRNNAAFTDRKVSLKFGYTPNATDEYAVGYQRINSDKGDPNSTSTAVPVRYWQWPTWDKDSYYFSTNTALGAKSYLRARGYFDSYDNSITAFTNGTYSTIQTAGPFAPTGLSLYRDFTRGAILEAGTQAIPGNFIKATLQAKADIHRESPGNGSWTMFKDQTLVAGVEDGLSLRDNLEASLGFGLDRQKPEDSGPVFALSNPKSFFHAQGGLFWKATDRLQAYATFAQKDHFPTLKDRYSLRLGSYIANPDLKPEQSTNYELGLKSRPATWVEADVAVFQSDIKDLIQSIPNVSGTLAQMQNIGKVRHTGVEGSLALTPKGPVSGGVTYTYLDRNNLSNPATKLTGTPRNRATGFIQDSPDGRLTLLASVECQDALWDSNALRLGGYTTAGLSAKYQATARLSLNGGFQNLLDRNYQLATGFPLPGRTWFVNARYAF